MQALLWELEGYFVLCLDGVRWLLAAAFIFPTCLQLILAPEAAWGNSLLHSGDERSRKAGLAIVSASKEVDGGLREPSLRSGGWAEGDPDAAPAMSKGLSQSRGSCHCELLGTWGWSQHSVVRKEAGWPPL